MQNDTYYLADALEKLLEKERTAILAGALKDMGKIANEKERLLNTHELTAPNQNVLDQLHKKADRNQQLLAAAIQGVRAVTTRLGALRKGQSALNTYNKNGQKAVLGSGLGATLQHKA
jgi:hypothetical protein